MNVQLLIYILLSVLYTDKEPLLKLEMLFIILQFFIVMLANTFSIPPHLLGISI